MLLDISAPIVPFEGFGEIKLYRTRDELHELLEGEAVEAEIINNDWIRYDIQNSVELFFHLKNNNRNILYVIFLHLFRFISSSVISSVIDVLLAWLLLDVLKIWMTSDFWRIAIASLVARVISTIENYIYNKKIVFKERTETKQTAIRFLILTVVITILSTLFVYVFSTLGIMSEKLAKPVGDLLLFLLSYNVQMKWVFSKE